ncbi:hypothetical protein D910_06590 [Dendroctonus ponderosae]|uniref:Hepatocyte growth factor-regulated tyrosine kinase substrate n=1 Tax=Dendroctonus ponderosae TaxID=77166 RepID=U4UF40_DENPD|nr:hypothetical protein D910_06590 [Dendroctonus ponderosae]
MYPWSSHFDKLLEKATSHLIMEPDWPSILRICDLIRQNDVSAKTALVGVKKKLNSPNPHTSLFALSCLESMVKNCGVLVAEELTTKANCEFLHDLVKNTPHENVKQKLLELIQAWNFAFRNNPKHGNLKDLMATMKSEGYKFPVLQESDAMFSADTAPEWIVGDSCFKCRSEFTIINRRHHCRACGQVFCGACSSKTKTLPKYGIEKEVRVCDTCYEAGNKPATVPKTPKQGETELPQEYLNSSLAQQSQEPPRKNEDELKEEEDLQLALALSQSEAEAKEKEKLRVTHALLNNPPRKDTSNPELDRYLNRSFWESIQSNDPKDRPTSPSAPSPASSILSNEPKFKIKENGTVDVDLEEFIKALKSQVEIFVNRMKSNSSRGRSITNDTSVQSLFLNITNLHSRLLKYIQDHDDSRLYYERLQDKLTQVKDARAALDALREEHRDKLRREAEEAERQRQLQMAHKLEIMRKKKQEYLQYQRQLALQRIQEQEREMQMRQEQQKQQYLMGPPQFAGYMGSPVHAPQFQPPNQPPPGMAGYYGQYGQIMGQPANPGPPGSAGPPQGPHMGAMPAQMGAPHPQQFASQPGGPPLAFNPPMMGVSAQGPPAHGMPPHPGMQLPNGQGAPQMQYPIQGGPPVHNLQQVPSNGEQTQTAELISFD